MCERMMANGEIGRPAVPNEGSTNGTRGNTGPTASTNNVRENITPFMRAPPSVAVEGLNGADSTNPDTNNGEQTADGQTPTTLGPVAGRRVGNKGKEWSEHDSRILVTVVDHIKTTQGNKFKWNHVFEVWNSICSGECRDWGLLQNSCPRSKDALGAKYRALSEKQIEPNNPCMENADPLPEVAEAVVHIETGTVLENETPINLNVIEPAQEEEGVREFIEKLKVEVSKAIGSFERKPLRKPSKPVPIDILNKADRAIALFLEEKGANWLDLERLNALAYASGKVILDRDKDYFKARRKVAMRFEMELVEEEKRLRREIGLLQLEINRRQTHSELTESSKRNLAKLRKTFRGLRALRDFKNLKESLVSKLHIISQTLSQKREDKVRKYVRNLPPKMALQATKSSSRSTNQIPIADIRAYWYELIGRSKEFTTNAELDRWKASVQKPPSLVDYNDTVTKWEELCKKARPWKAPGPDGIPNWVWKNLPSIRQHLFSMIMDLYLGRIEPPPWLSHGRAILLYKKGDPKDPGNYRTIVCLNTAYKLCSGLIAKWTEKQIEGKFPSEQLACRKGIWGCVEAHIIDASLTRDATDQKRRDLSVAWIDFQKAFDSVPHKYLRWILKSIGLHPAIRLLLKKLMNNWSIKYELKTIKGIVSSDALEVKNGVLQGDSLSPLLFCLCIAPISFWLNNRLPKYETSFRRGTEQALRHNHLYFMDDLKLYSPNKPDLLEVIQEMGLLLKSIGCAMNSSKCGIAHIIRTVGQDGPETLGDIPVIRDTETYKYLGIEQQTKICWDVIWDSMSEKLLARTLDIFSSKLNIRQMVTSFNTMVPSVVRFITMNIIIGRGKFETQRSKFVQLDLQIRGILKDLKVRFRNQNCYRLYENPMEGGLGLKKLENTFEESIIYAYCYLTCQPNMQNASRYLHNLAKRSKRSIVSDFIHVMTDNGINVVELPEITKRENEPGLVIRGEVYTNPTKAAKAIVRLIHGIRNEDKQRLFQSEGYKMMALITDYERWNIDKHYTWLWVRKGLIGPLVWRNVTAAQENQLLYTSMGNAGRLARCRWSCQQRANPRLPPQETVAHIVSDCSHWRTNIYVERHNFVASKIYYELCWKYGMIPDHYTRQKDPVRENDAVKLYWDRPVDDVWVNFNRPDIICFQKKHNEQGKYSKIWIIEISVAWYQNLLLKEKAKFDKYSTNSMEITSHPGPNLRGILEKRFKCPVEVVPVVVGVFGEISTSLPNQIRRLQLPEHRTKGIIERLSRSAVIGTHWVIKAHMTKPPLGH